MNYIEYYGLPGCGKTTKLEENKEGYYINGVSIQEGKMNIKVNKLYGVVLFFFQVNVLDFVEIIFKYSLYKKELRSFLKVSLNLSICLRYLYRAYEDTELNIINDNGFVQTLVSIMKREKGWDECLVDMYLKVFFPDLITAAFHYMDIPVELCVDRIYQREKDILVKTGKKERTKELLEQEKILFDNLSIVLFSKGIDTCSDRKEKNDQK